MKIKLTQDVPVQAKHKMTKGRILDVIRVEEKEHGRGNEAGYWVQGNGEEVKIWAHECEEVQPFAGTYLVTDPCYVCEDSSPEEVLAGENKWGDFLEKTDFGTSIGDGWVIPGVGTIIKSGATSCGDGTWKVGDQEVSADAGLVCIVELEPTWDMEKHSKEKGHHPMFTLGALTKSREEAERWFDHVQTYDPWQ